MPSRGVPRHSSGREALPDIGGEPSVYAQAQVAAAPKGVSLHTEGILDECRQLQRRATLALVEQAGVRSHQQTRRELLLALATLALWLVALMALMSRV